MRARGKPSSGDESVWWREIKSARERNERMRAEHDTIRETGISNAESWGAGNLSIGVLARSTYVSAGVRGPEQVENTGRARTY